MSCVMLLLFKVVLASLRLRRYIEIPFLLRSANWATRMRYWHECMQVRDLRGLSLVFRRIICAPINVYTIVFAVIVQSAPCKLSA